MSYQQIVTAFDVLKRRCEEFFKYMLSDAGFMERKADDLQVFSESGSDQEKYTCGYPQQIAADFDALLVLIEGEEVGHIATVAALEEDSKWAGGWADKLRRLQRENGQLRLALADHGLHAHAVNDQAREMAERVRRQLQELEVSFFEDIVEPLKGSTSVHQEITTRICGPKGLNWDWTEPYIEDGQFAWCGAEAAYALGAAGLKPSIRRKVMPSCYRLYEFCHNEDGGQRVVPHISKAQAGDIVVVGNEQSPKWGSHITTLLVSHLVPEYFAGIALEDTLIGMERWERTLEIFQGIRDKESKSSFLEEMVFLHEGNAKAYGPDGTRREGVGRRWRPMVPGKTEYGVMYVYRFLPSDYTDIKHLEVL
jgi:hypothetical protein